MTTEQSDPRFAVGNVWERDGRRRVIVRVSDQKMAMFSGQACPREIVWARPAAHGKAHKTTKAWGGTWLQWVNKATLVQQENP